jgi:hypothetical protein
MTDLRVCGSFSFCEIFLRRMTVAKKKNSEREKALVILLEKSKELGGAVASGSG